MKPLVVAILTGVIFTGIALSACGVKPGSLKTPASSEVKTFPRNYPTDNPAKSALSNPYEKESVKEEESIEIKQPQTMMNNRLTGY